jgi:hypothetical protein
MSDFNRLRWTFYALKTNAALRGALLERQSGQIFDSTYLFPSQPDLPINASIVLWDGFNSYLELLRKRPELGDRSDLTYACVGSFAEIETALPERSLRLFADSDLYSVHTLKAPLAFQAALKLKTTFRAFKNLASANSRHRKLSRGGNLVFCGLIRPTKQVVANILTNQKLLALRKEFEELGEFGWTDGTENIQKHIRMIYRHCQNIEPSSAEDYSGIYAVLNLCTRVYAISALNASECEVFTNEYGFHSNFDPYDVYAYDENIFLDFGSSRGACYWYPRTMDMQETGKRFVPFRLIGEHQALASYLDTQSAEDYVSQMDVYVAHVLDTAKRH